MRSQVWAVVALSMAMVGCGDAGSGDTVSTSPTATALQLMVTPLNSELVIGVDRVSIALFDQSQRPIRGATATLTLQQGGTTLETRPLQDIGPDYGQLPIYVTAVRFPSTGTVTFVVRATVADGRTVTGSSQAAVAGASHAFPIGYKVPHLKQPILGDPGVTIGQIDSGVPPDPWHTATIADGLAQNRAMLLYFGEPGFCKSNTCGPTVKVLQKLCQAYCDRLLFEHIDDHFPAGPDANSTDNPAFAAFGLQTDPWVFFVTAAGVISDRFEGPVTVEELRSAADGTLAGKVPAVEIALGG